MCGRIWLSERLPAPLTADIRYAHQKISSKILASNVPTLFILIVWNGGIVPLRNEAMKWTCAGLMLAISMSASGLMSVAALGQQYDENSANFLYPACKAFAEGRTVDVSGENYCSGEISALTAVASLINPSTGLQSCPPGNGTDRQGAMVVVRYLEMHPELMNRDFRQLALAAFHQAWPCRMQ